MRARALALGLLSSALVLSVGWQLGAQEQAALVGGADAPGASTSNDGGATPAPTAAPSAGAGGAAQSTTAVSGSFTGMSMRTRYGDVQVQITVQNGAITDVVPLRLTDADSRSASISNRSAPILRREVLAAQSANVQGVSGATYTSTGYLTSLQSALDQAGLRR